MPLLIDDKYVVEVVLLVGFELCIRLVRRRVTKSAGIILR